MPIPSTDGDELAFVVSPLTKRMKLQWVNGDVAFSNDMTETVMSLLVEDEGPFTTDRRRGPGPLSVATDTADARSQIKARAEERLQLAIDDGRLQAIDVQVDRIGPGKFNLVAGYITRSGYKGLVKRAIG